MHAWITMPYSNTHTLSHQSSPSYFLCIQPKRQTNTKNMKTTTHLHLHSTYLSLSFFPLSLTLEPQKEHAPIGTRECLTTVRDILENPPQISRRQREKTKQNKKIVFFFFWFLGRERKNKNQRKVVGAKKLRFFLLCQCF